VGIPSTWRETEIQVGCVKEGILFLFVQRVDLPHSVCHPASAFPLFSLLRPSRAVSMPWVCFQICWCPSAAFDCFDASQTPYPHISQLLHLSDDISCGICGSMWLWALEEFSVGGMALTERGNFLSCGTKSVFLLAVELSVECVNNTGCNRSFQDSSGEDGYPPGLCHDSLTVAARILALNHWLWLLVMSSSRGENG